MDFSVRRKEMVRRHLQARGIRDPRVLAAMGKVQREAFLPPELAEFAYEDAPLPIAAGQTISQPYIVALMVEALRLAPGDSVLEIGTGSGYAAAVLAEIAERVYTIERHAELADGARRRLAELGYQNVEVRCGDGTLGWPEHAPFQAIVVAAGGPEPPRSLLDQLAIGGRLVMPVGGCAAPGAGPDHAYGRRPVRDARSSAAVRFVPLIGDEGWAEPEEEGVAPSRGILPARPGGPLRARRASSRREQVARLVAECAEPLSPSRTTDLGPLLERIGDARVVLLGEATHGTSEFYRMRARITRELIERRGFTAVAVEADWPDAAAVDRYVRHIPAPPRRLAAVPALPHLDVAQPRDRARSSNGCAAQPRPVRARAAGRASPGSTSTACTRRPTRWCATSMASIRRWRQIARAALRMLDTRGRTIRPRTGERR